MENITTFKEDNTLKDYELRDENDLKNNDTLKKDNNILNEYDLENTNTLKKVKHRSYSESCVDSIKSQFPVSKYIEFKDKYKIGKKIGEGTYSMVYHVTENENEYAMKRISVNKLEKSRYDKFLLELEISFKLNHINIVKCYDIFRTKNSWYIVSEYCESGTFRDLIKQMSSIVNPNKREIFAKYYLYQLRNAIQYLHENNIIHRDLKPDNILLTTTNKESNLKTVKLADFGFSRYFDITKDISGNGYDDLVSTVCGSPIYMAPELLLNTKYNIKADIWSFGLIMYELLHGHNPFYYAKNIQELKTLVEFKKITVGDFSKECIDLLEKILSIDPVYRISWKDFFDHPWFQSYDSSYYEESDIEANETEFIDDVEDEIFQMDEELQETIPTTKKVSSFFPSSLTKKKSEEDFVFVQMENTNSIKNETYSGSIIKLFTSSIVYLFGKDKNCTQSL
jgi:serine/threonine protein kinase